jgi:hypothetical protein
MPDFSDALLKHIIQQAQSDPRSPLAQSLNAQPTDTKTGASGAMRAAGVGDMGDLLSTFANMANGAGDQNPTLIKGHPVASAAILSAEDLAMQYLIHKLSESHPTLAKVLGYGEGGLGMFNTVRNAQHAPRFETENLAQKGAPDIMALVAAKNRKP